MDIIKLLVGAMVFIFGLPLGMAALSADRQTPTRAFHIKGYKVDGGSVIYKGSLVCLNSLGYLVPAGDTAGFTGVVGVADEKVDNSAGADGDLECRVVSGDAYQFAATSITQAMVGTVMYVVDDQTFDDAAGATNEIPAGILVKRDGNTQGWLYIPEGGMVVDIPNLSVATADLQDDAVTGPKIAADAVDSEHLAAGAIDTEHFAAGSVDAAAIAADAVTGAEIADDAVDSEHIAAGAIDPEHFAASAVETAAIDDGAVTGPKLGTGVVAQEIVAGQDETSDTTIPVTGIGAGDELVRLLVQDGTSGVLTQRANADFTVGAAELTVVGNAADNTANKYLITWVKHT